MGDESGSRSGGATTIVEELAPPTAATRTRGVLTIVSGPQAGRVVSIARGSLLQLGRTEECEISFNDASLSRIHATVQAVGSTFVVRDESSTNGTFVNDTRVVGAEPLRDGDRIQLGRSTSLRFQLVDEYEEETLKRV